jgi:GNAT superfamily N-acetyltransferase
VIREARPADLAGIARVSLAAGSTGSESGGDPDYVRLLLAAGTVRVAVDSLSMGSVLGWAATRCTPLGSLLSDLFVDPAQHGRGHGAELLRSVWPDPDAPGRLTFSSQHASALPLYARAGLRARWPLLYLTGSRGRVPGSGRQTHLVAPAVAAAADADLAGGDRAADYDHWTQTGGAALLVRDGRRVVAAGAVRDGQLVHLTLAAVRFWRPVIHRQDRPPKAAPGDTEADEALRAALAAAPGEQVSVCLPGPHPSVTTLLRAGFRVRDYDVAMATPELTLPTTWAYSPGLV